jgi:hypothetical protein
LRVVSGASSSSSRSGGRHHATPDLLPASSKQAPESKLRYRDGQVVSTRGEKVVIERVGEEWDGGSR